MIISEYPEKLVGQHVFPICIPTPFAVGDVYSYLLVDEKIVLVDTGHKADEAWQLVSGKLKELGLGVSDLDEIWLTHGHPDHFGQALRLADASGAKVLAHPLEIDNLMSNRDAERFRKFFESYGIPEKYIAVMGEQLQWLKQFLDPIEPSQMLEDGQSLHSGSLHFKVKWLPGHAPGHVVFVEDSGLILGGDVLLDHISTNALINFDVRTGERNKSLLQYRNSLGWMKQQSGYVLPGHGKPVSDVAGTAGRHLSEQERRYRAILRLLGEEPSGLFDLALRLFPSAREPGVTFLALSEVLGYLDWGMEEQEVRREKNGASFIFHHA